MTTIPKGASDRSIYIEVLDTSSLELARKTGLVYNSAGMTAYYVREGGSAVAIALANLAAPNSAHADGGFKEVDATNMPGVYRLDLPDAALAAGAGSVVVVVRGATSAAQSTNWITLVDNPIGVNVTHINGTEIGGDGSANDKWGPAS